MFEKKDFIYAVYEEKSFSKAAKKMFVSQPSLSAMIKKSEEKIGLDIFDRSCNPVQLTNFGKKYMDYVEKIMSIEKELSNYVCDINNLKTGSFSLGSNSLYVSYVLPQYVFNFLQKYPNIELNLVESSTKDLEERLMSNELDIIIDNKELSSDLYEKYYFGTEYLVFAVPANYSCNNNAKDYQFTYDEIINNKHINSEKRTVPLSLFKDIPIIIMTQGNDTRARTDKIFDYFNISPKISLELNQLSTIFHIASAGSAACFISDTLIKKYPKKIEDMYFYTLPISLSRRDVYFQFKINKYLSKAVLAFINTCIPTKIC